MNGITSCSRITAAVITIMRLRLKLTSNCRFSIKELRVIFRINSSVDPATSKTGPGQHSLGVSGVLKQCHYAAQNHALVEDGSKTCSTCPMSKYCSVRSTRRATDRFTQRNEKRRQSRKISTPKKSRVGVKRRHESLIWAKRVSCNCVCG